MYLVTLSRRLNDIYDDFANPASLTVDLFLGICFEACKLNQVLNDFLKNDYVLWDANHASSNTHHGSIKKKCVFANFVELLKINLVKALHFSNLFVTIIEC